MVSSQPTRKVIRQLRAAGFLVLRTQGSHTVWGLRGVTVTVPDGHTNISPGVYRQILKKIEEAGRD